jgi:ubiquinone/menaquinone biosynthesis C-methylase UbiE
MADLDAYLSMQKAQYAADFKRVGEQWVVGHYDYHENVPYETLLLYMYGDIRRPLFTDWGGRKALDYGCGEGRMIRRLSGLFERVDGVDISEDMARNAQERSPNSKIWVTSGDNCAEAETGAYDFVYTTISMQHIGSFDIRDKILRDLHRVMKPGAKGTLQMLFSKHYPFRSSNYIGPVAGALVEIMPHDQDHAGWFQNRFDAKGTNSGCDTMIGQNDLPKIKEYLETMFSDVHFWFHDISIGRGDPRILPDTHPNSHIHDNYHGTHFIFIHFTKPA